MQQEPRPIRRHDHTPEEIRARFPNGEPSLIPYRYQYALALVVFGLSLLVGAIQVAGPSELGLSPVAARWLGVLAAVLAGASAVLPKIQAPREGK